LFRFGRATAPALRTRFPAAEAELPAALDEAMGRWTAQLQMMHIIYTFAD
jgi:hypothetical protein